MLQLIKSTILMKATIPGTHSTSSFCTSRFALIFVLYVAVGTEHISICETQWDLLHQILYTALIYSLRQWVVKSTPVGKSSKVSCPINC